jgi:hypothetical protein
VRLNELPAVAASRTWRGQRRDVGRLDVAGATSPPSRASTWSRDVGRRDVAAVVRLDVEPAAWAGAMS